MQPMLISCHERIQFVVVKTGVSKPEVTKERIDG